MPVCIKKAQTHHLDLRFLPLDGIIIFAFLYFVKAEFSKIMPLAGNHMFNPAGLFALSA